MKNALLMMMTIVLVGAGCDVSSRRSDGDAGLSPTDGGGVASDGGAECGTVEYLRYDQPGPDGIWNTPDDRIAERDTWTFTDLLQTRSRVAFTAPGPDGIWLTADDVVGDWEDLQYDAAASRLTTELKTAAGGDGVWFTADDQVGTRTVFDGYDGMGYAGATQYGAPGPDGVWGTGDDAIAGWYAVTRHGARYQEFAYGPGPDGLWHTADDQVQVRVDFGLAADGRFLVDYYGSPGQDGAWGTADDVRVGLLVVLCDYGALTMYDGPGADGAWDTSDDHINSRLALKSGIPCVNLCQGIIF